MRLTRLHLILILVVLGAIGLFIAQQKKNIRPSKPKNTSEDITITKTQAVHQQSSQDLPIIPANPVSIETASKEKISKEAIAVAGEYWLIANKTKKDVIRGQITLHQSKVEFDNGNYETALLLARQSISEFKSAQKKQTIYYRVRKNDCLWKIAGMKKHYGKGWLWPKIWEANKKKVKIPQLIYPKQKLIIP